MQSRTRTWDAGRLTEAAAAILGANGVPATDAYLVADSLVQAELWGHESHGLLRLPWYVDRLRSGVMRAVTEPAMVVDTGAVALIDGRDGVGQVLAARAAEEAVARAKVHGVAAVGVRNSNHFGTAAYFTRMAPPEGCIGMLTTNSSPAMAPWGGREKTVGSNPWSVAAPAGSHPAVVMDISGTTVARGKIYLARQNDAEIPSGWAITADGHPTTDPIAALTGTILPMGGHKGYAISVMMDVLSGVLTGSGFGAQVSGPYQSEHRSRSGHLFFALNVAAFLPLADFRARVDDLIDELKSTPLAVGFEEVFYPGEPEDRTRTRKEREGIALPAQTVSELVRLARESGVDPTIEEPG